MLKSLKVYRVVKELRAYVYRQLSTMPRSLRYPLADRVCNDMFDCVHVLAMISNETDKQNQYQLAGEVLILTDCIMDELEFMIECEALPIKQSAHIATLLDEMERQMKGFRKYLADKDKESQNSISTE